MKLESGMVLNILSIVSVEADPYRQSENGFRVCLSNNTTLQVSADDAQTIISLIDDIEKAMEIASF